MQDKSRKYVLVAIFVAVACALAGVGYAVGKTTATDQANKEREQLCALNRSSIENIDVGDGPIRVIGHRSPDSDTVCSAIAYARLLTLLGYKAEAAVADTPNHETAYILKEAGVDTPPVLEDASGQYIFLVDHSEYAQAAEGMKDAHIVGVLDHHGAGTVTTGNTLVYEAKPIGATSTIVWLDYKNYGLEIDKSTAYLLLGAILSDTANLTVTTTTETDKQAVKALSELAGVPDTNALYKTLHAESMSFEGMTDKEALFSDYKEYEASGVKFGIGLLPALDDEAAKALSKRMVGALKDNLKASGVDLLYADVGIRENGEKIDYIVPADDRAKETLVAAFPNYDEFDGTAYIYRKGLGRKTKFVPGLTDFLAAHPSE